jgi:UDP-glucose 4-epimerase
MKVLITGGAGYIGSHTNRFLFQKGIQTVVLDDISDGHKESVVCGKLVVGSFGDEKLLDELMGTEKFDAVIHFAAFASVPDSVINPSKYYKNNVSNMLTLIDMCVKHGVKNFIFSSSAATFGESLYAPMDEDHPQEPINAYGMTKLIGEKILADYALAYGIRYCAFRYFCAAGAWGDGAIGEAHNPETHVIPVMIKAALNGRKFYVFGDDYDTKDGSCIRDYIHVRDLAEAHYLGMKYIMSTGKSECFNLGSGSGFSVFELIDTLKGVSGIDINYEVSARRQGDPSVLLASNEKAKKILNWEPQFSDIKTILNDAWNWEKERKY